ncbi:aminoglycoside phosphotransferase family protein [Streptomyces luteogriseus]|uniref:aminoglycoside phosphotransferase family protein n=1 Tax=Streptomyces luteogriseus TaxID=68233 RepID=UPI002E3005CA|nr:aminoglycoside phosphotransferase family protein [Streptomyces luteogriseus]WTJ32676.1 aminoglycoside phosphotransferase family protein [Streptomyces luteogriseus]
MCAVRMHEDELAVDVPLVGRLIAEQFPQWAGLPLRRLESSGTENAMFRLGADKVVRLPRHPRAVEAIAHELHWLPRLAPALPTPSPEPLGRGEPDDGFPWPWSVFGWLDGRNPVPGALEEPVPLAEDLAAYVTALRGIDASQGPPGYRGVPLAARDPFVREALAHLAGRVDTAAVTRVWEAALRAPEHTGPPVWAHGDLMAGNLLVTGGRLSAVIDFGTVGVGDPAVDLISAWCVLPAAARDVLRDAVGADEAEWARARGWALSIAVIALPYYWDTNPPVAENSRHAIGEILAETA